MAVAVLKQISLAVFRWSYLGSFVQDMHTGVCSLRTGLHGRGAVQYECHSWG